MEMDPVSGLPLPKSLPGSPEALALATMTPAEKTAYLRKLHFPKVEDLTAGLPEGISSVLAGALLGRDVLVVLRGQVRLSELPSSNCNDN